MDNEQGTPINAQGGGEQPVPRVFTQAEVDRIVAERLNRTKEKFADYETLREKAAKWAEIEEAQKTEAQKVAEKLAALERERDEIMQRSTQRLIRAAFIAEAAKVGAAHPGDVFALADLSGVSVDESGEVLGVAEAVKAIVEAGRVPLLATKPQAPRLDGGAGSGVRIGEQERPLSDEELAYAKKLGLSAERYAEQKRKVTQAAANR